MSMRTADCTHGERLAAGIHANALHCPVICKAKGDESKELIVCTNFWIIWYNNKYLQTVLIVRMFDPRRSQPVTRNTQNVLEMLIVLSCVPSHEKQGGR